MYLTDDSVLQNLVDLLAQKQAELAELFEEVEELEAQLDRVTTNSPGTVNTLATFLQPQGQEKQI